MEGVPIYFLVESVLWPAGSYGIPKAASGCPSADGFQWLIGRRYQDTEDNNPSNHKSQQFHLDATVDSKRGILRSFCMKTDTSTDNRRSSWPPGGAMLNYILCVHNDNDDDDGDDDVRIPKAMKKFQETHNIAPPLKLSYFCL